jgi:hypothetical protein
MIADVRQRKHRQNSQPFQKKRWSRDELENEHEI